MLPEAECVLMMLDTDFNTLETCRVGQHRLYTPYMTVYLAISWPKMQYIHHIYMVLANPRNVYCFCVLMHCEASPCPDN